VARERRIPGQRRQVGDAAERDGRVGADQRPVVRVPREADQWRDGPAIADLPQRGRDRAHATRRDRALVVAGLEQRDQIRRRLLVAELRERDYFGQTVNRCARIRSLGRGGQTLVSASTRELIRSVAMEPLSFRDLGEQQLRDFQEPERVYEVVAQTGAGPTEPKQAAGI